MGVMCLSQTEALHAGQLATGEGNDDDTKHYGTSALILQLGHQLQLEYCVHVWNPFLATEGH